MTDKNSNFEDMEYIDTTDDSLEYPEDIQEEPEEEYGVQPEEEYTNEESSYDDEGEEDSYEDDSDEDDSDEDEQPVRKKNSMLIIILIILLLIIGLLAFFIVPKVTGGKGGEQNANNYENHDNAGQEQNFNQQENLADSFFDAAGGENSDMMSIDFNNNGEANVNDGEGENTVTVSDVPQNENPENNEENNNNNNNSDLFEEQNLLPEKNQEENNSIMVVYNKASRLNPFKPPVIEKEKEAIPFETINNTSFEIIEPPTTSVEDKNLTNLLQTQISGILYDDESPSAIVKLNGSDKFVKVGDVVSGYTIDSITNDKVQITYKGNSYVASVGELFTRGSLEKQAAIVNLENKFAGRYKNNN